MMKDHTELRDFSQIAAALKTPVTLVVGSAASLFVELYKKYHIPDNMQICDTVLTDKDLQSIKSTLSISFLGQNYVYICKGYDALQNATKKSIAQYFSQYTGPHAIIIPVKKECAVLQKNSQNFSYITVPQVCTYKAAQNIFQQLPTRSTLQVAYFLKQVYARQKQYTFQELIMLYYYSQVVGRQQDRFFADWFPKLAKVEQSLFQLSELFLYKKKEHFAALWSTIYEQYSEMFWLVFWSEQIYKAYFYVYFSKKMQQNRARTIGYRLPFSFLKTGWRRQNLKELRAAHNALYEIDFAVKRGASLSLVYNWALKYVSNYFL